MKTNFGVFVRLALPTIALTTVAALALSIAGVASGLQGLGVGGRLVFVVGIGRALFILASPGARREGWRWLSWRESYPSALAIVPLTVITVLLLMRLLIWFLDVMQW